MNINFGKPACPKCKHNVLLQGSQAYSQDGQWVTLKELTEKKIKLSPFVPYAYVSDPTNLLCVKCKHHLSFEECENVLPDLPIKLPIPIRDSITILPADEIKHHSGITIDEKLEAWIKIK